MLIMLMKVSCLLSEKNEKGDLLVCVFNMVPVERKGFTIGVPVAGIYEEVWNTELEEFGGVWKEHNMTVKNTKKFVEGI